MIQRNDVVDPAGCLEDGDRGMWTLMQHLRLAGRLKKAQGEQPRCNDMMYASDRELVGKYP